MSRSCGSVIPGRTFIAEDNVMIAVFKSDSIMERKGFAANFFQGWLEIYGVYEIDNFKYL